MWCFLAGSITEVDFRESFEDEVRGVFEGEAASVVLDAEGISTSRSAFFLIVGSSFKLDGDSSTSFLIDS